MDNWEQDLRYYDIGAVQVTRKRNGEYIKDVVILYECGDCGAFVESRDTHDKWHQQRSEEARRG